MDNEELKAQTAGEESVTTESTADNNPQGVADLENEEVNNNEFDDSDENEENSEDKQESSKSNTDTEPTEKTSFADKFKKKQTKEENADYAQKRREAQALKEREDQAYRKGLIDAVGGVNPYTDEPIETQADIDEYLLMKKIDKDGGDPITDYHRYLKKEKNQRETKSESTFDYKADKKSFEEQYPDTDLNLLINDEEFKSFADGLVGKIPLATIFKKFLGVKSNISSRVKEKVQTEMAKKVSSPGSLRKTSEKKVLSYSEMSDDDFEKMIQKAKNGELR